MTLPTAWVRRPHGPECDGSLYRRPEVVYTDSIGRIGNGGWVAHEYRCNQWWSGCPARVLVPETTLRAIAVDALEDASEIKG